MVRRLIQIRIEAGLTAYVSLLGFYGHRYGLFILGRHQSRLQMSNGRGSSYAYGSCDSFISCSQLQMHRYIYDFVPSRKMKELILINHDQGIALREK